MSAPDIGKTSRKRFIEVRLLRGKQSTLGSCRRRLFDTLKSREYHIFATKRTGKHLMEVTHSFRSLQRFPQN